MHGNVSSRGAGPGPPALRAQTVESIPAEAQVRHFDQLSPQATELFLALVAADGQPVHAPRPDDLEPGEVIAFTDYYLVGPAE